MRDAQGKKIANTDLCCRPDRNLTRLTENVGKYSTENAAHLAAVAASHGMELKEHNGDYLPDELILMHPALGVSSLNVAPEFGVVETRCYLQLAALEDRLVDMKLIQKSSDTADILRKAAVETGRWRKWMVGNQATLEVEDVLKD